MGSLSIIHWIIVLFVLGAFAAVAGLIVWLAVRTSGPAKAPPAPRPPPAMPEPPPAPIESPVGSPVESAIESRLRELDGLKAKGLVTDAEYEQRRAAILASL
jgi:hypothetical protein